MDVKEIMSPAAATCAPESDLGMVVRIMRDRNCGFLPVVDSHGIVVGVVTDRDASMAAASKRRPLSRVSAEETMSRPVFSCFPDENAKTVLGTMANRRVRRLPVVDKNGHLQGVLSIDDIARAPRRRGSPTAEEIVTTLKLIYARRGVAGATA